MVEGVGFGEQAVDVSRRQRRRVEEALGQVAAKLAQPERLGRVSMPSAIV